MKKSKQKNGLNLILLCAGALLGIFTLIIMVAPSVLFDYGLVMTKYNMYELINFADTLRVGLLLALIFACVMLATNLFLIVLKLLNKKFKLEPLFALCAAILAIAAGVLFLCAKPLLGYADASFVSLGVGAIMAGISTILSGVLLGVYAIKKLIK